jgi:hypothetical protein
VQLDLALAEFGPETALARESVKDGLKRAYQLFLSGNSTDARELDIDAFLPNLRKLDESIAALTPMTQLQRQAATAIGLHAGFIEQTRLLMSLQLASPVPWPLLGVVVSWAILLFCGFGVLSKLNSTSVAALALGAFAVANAIFLILEMNQPYTGLFHIPTAAVEQALTVMGR